MNTLNFIPNEPSVFAQLVDALRTKSEAELKVLYTRLFQKELTDEWAEITKGANFENVSEEDIIEAIRKNRSSH